MSTPRVVMVNTTIRGRRNCVDLYRKSGWIRGGSFSDPTGKLGSDAHCIKLMFCDGFKVLANAKNKITLSSSKPIGDAISVWKCRNLLIDGDSPSLNQGTGFFFKQVLCNNGEDISCDLVIDGMDEDRDEDEGGWGQNITVRNVMLHVMRIAYGSDILLDRVRTYPDLTAKRNTDVIEITGEGYDGNPARIIRRVTLRNVYAGEIYVDDATVEDLVIEPNCRIGNLNRKPRATGVVIKRGKVKG